MNELLDELCRKFNLSPSITGAQGYIAQLEAELAAANERAEKAEDACQFCSRQLLVLHHMTGDPSVDTRIEHAMDLLDEEGKTWRKSKETK
jgi:hypothetical protein